MKCFPRRSKPQPSRAPSSTAPTTASGLSGNSNRIDLLRPSAPELATRGPYQVGVRTLMFSNPSQFDVLAALDMAEGDSGVAGGGSARVEPVYDRPLTVEVWYPAASGTATGPTEYTGVMTRDGVTVVSLWGVAVRDAAPFIIEPMGTEQLSRRGCPLVIISHGYPGNRFLLSHLGEHLASRGFVVASIDHTDSNYEQVGAIGSSLRNRPLDTRFVLDAMAALGADPASFLGNGLLDASRVEHHETSTKRRPDAEAGVTLGRPGVLEQSVDALCLLTAREMELRDVREELHRRDEGFAHLRAALAESESQVASMRDELSSKMVVSDRHAHV